MDRHSGTLNLRTFKYLDNTIHNSKSLYPFLFHTISYCFIHTSYCFKLSFILSTLKEVIFANFVDFGRFRQKLIPAKFLAKMNLQKLILTKITKATGRCSGIQVFRNFRSKFFEKLVKELIFYFSLKACNIIKSELLHLIFQGFYLQFYQATLRNILMAV